MKEFYLKTKSGETINKIDAKCLDNAVEYFSKIKKMSSINLLDIFIVIGK